MTDNKARTASTIKLLTYPNGGSFARVLYNFVRKGLIIAKCDGRPYDKVLEEAIELGVEEVQELNDDKFRVCDFLS